MTPVYSRTAEGKTETMIRYADHHFVNIAAAVAYRIPINGKVYTSVVDLMLDYEESPQDGL